MTTEEHLVHIHETTRQEVWTKAWLALAGSEYTKEPSSATVWADDCLAAFDIRFSAPIIDKDTFINDIINPDTHLHR